MAYLWKQRPEVTDEVQREYGEKGEKESRREKRELLIIIIDVTRIAIFGLFEVTSPTFDGQFGVSDLRDFRERSY